MCPIVLDTSWLLGMVSVKPLYLSEHWSPSVKWRMEHPKIPLGLQVCVSRKKTVMHADNAVALTSGLLAVRGCVLTCASLIMGMCS